MADEKAKVAPRFLQRMPPGTPIPGVGFILPGQYFDAPEGFIPSKLGAHLPMNVEAQELFKKCHPKLDVPPLVEVAVEKPKRGESGLALSELDGLQRAGQLDAGDKPKQQAAQGKPGDRKL